MPGRAAEWALGISFDGRISFDLLSSRIWIGKGYIKHKDRKNSCTFFTTGKDMASLIEVLQINSISAKIRTWA